MEEFLPVAGATLALVHFTQPNPRGVVLYLHGNADTLRNADTFAERFIRCGYDVILFDYRGYSKSTGSITNEADLHRDAQAVYDYVRQSYDEDEIIPPPDIRVICHIERFREAEYADIQQYKIINHVRILR